MAKNGKVKSAAAVLGSRGGKERGKKLTPEQLSEIGRKAGKASGVARNITPVKRKKKQ